MADQTPEFLSLFLRAEPDLRAFVGSLITDAALREDVFQDVAVTLWEQFAKYDKKRAPFGAWARGVAANKILQTRRRWGRLPIAFPPETIEKIVEAYGAGDEPANADRTDALRECVRRLPDNSRKIIELRYEDCLSGRQLARKLGRSVDAIYQTLSRIRRGLEDCIRQRLDPSSPTQ